MSSVSLRHGDNRAVMNELKASGHQFALAYLDPPFFTGRDFETDTGEHAFSDRWASRDDYLEALFARISLAFELLQDDGCMVIHIDPTVSHYVRVWCDCKFGSDKFASEIIWRYRRWPSKTPNFQRMHDVLLRFVKNPEVKPRWNQLFEPPAPSTVATWGTRKQRAVADASGRRVRSSVIEEESPGAPLSDVWDIGIIAPVAKERTGYPTQKPEALLERLVLACTHPGDLVLDPYCGSGTTLAVCARLGRRAIGIDSSPVAFRIAGQRLGIEAGKSYREAL